uniref:hypothetical protein n=1 Tax=Candidatus Phytoplasma asiaticum TaxID=2763338 RepID=UPI001BA80E24|nr:hypothetical protein ['Parthenium hysterophorus' phyllody phytoplasma]
MLKEGKLKHDETLVKGEEFINKYIFHVRKNLADCLKAERSRCKFIISGQFATRIAKRLINKRKRVLCKVYHRSITNQQIHDIRKIRTIRINK